MKGKAKKEEVDLTTLPKANMVVSSLMLNFKNQDNKLKIFETFYKGLQNDPLYFFITSIPIYLRSTSGTVTEPSSFTVLSISCFNPNRSDR